MRGDGNWVDLLQRMCLHSSLSGSGVPTLLALGVEVFTHVIGSPSRVEVVLYPHFTLFLVDYSVILVFYCGVFFVYTQTTCSSWGF